MSRIFDKGLSKDLFEVYEQAFWLTDVSEAGGRDMEAIFRNLMVLLSQQPTGSKIYKEFALIVMMAMGDKSNDRVTRRSVIEAKRFEVADATPLKELGITGPLLLNLIGEKIYTAGQLSRWLRSRLRDRTKGRKKEIPGLGSEEIGKLGDLLFDHEMKRAKLRKRPM